MFSRRLLFSVVKPINFKLINTGTYHFSRTNISFSGDIGSFAQKISDSLVSKGLDKNEGITHILDEIYNCDEITNVCPNLAIRLASLRASVARAVLELNGRDPDLVQNLSIGSVLEPEHIPEYSKFIKNFNDRAATYLMNTKQHRLSYDLLSKGGEVSRLQILKKINEHYGFPIDIVNGFFAENSSISTGARTLKDFADSLIEYAVANGGKHRFVQPDNSFPVWFGVMQNGKSKVYDNFREIETLPTKPENKLHLVKEQITEFYKQKGVNKFESWYLTMVGNPSGTKMTPEQFVEVCEEIVKHNPDAVIICDSVYCRTLPKELCKELFSKITKDPSKLYLLENMIFLESWSKSHGFCAERLAVFFSKNPVLFRKMHAAEIAYQAGPERFKDFQLLSLASMTPKDEIGPEKLHLFWRDERKGLLKYLMNHPKADLLFEKEQKHIRNEDMEEPCGLYVTLKLKPNVNGRMILVNTGCIGVDVKMNGDPYHRFSVGTLTKPIFSKYV
jgi:aspartate/methionine/tyrosine aminotransferase